MNLEKLLGALGAVVFTLPFSMTSDAALIDRGGGLIYDDILNVTWLQDINYAKTSGYDSDGSMTFSDANAWAQNLIYYDSARDISYDSWRLPSMDVNNDGTNVDCGLNIVNCSDNELGHLYYVDNITTLDSGIFFNIQPLSFSAYWSTTQNPLNAATNYVFYFNGLYDFRTITLEGYGWALMDGDVGAVPIPSAIWLFGSGLIGLIGISKRKKI